MATFFLHYFQESRAFDAEYLYLIKDGVVATSKATGLTKGLGEHLLLLHSDMLRWRLG